MNRMEWNGINGDTFHEMLYVGVTFNLGQTSGLIYWEKKFFLHSSTRTIERTELTSFAEREKERESANEVHSMKQMPICIILR